MCIHEQEPFRAAPLSPQTGEGKACGTFGELLQGRLVEEDSDFLVTFPIALYSYVTFVSEPASATLMLSPPDRWKSQKLAEMILKHYRLPSGGRLMIKSELPVGKGLASSSADLVATARALCACFHLDLPLSLLLHFMAQIEPSDGVMYPGVIAFYHRQVRLREVLGMLPPLTIVGLDEGGETDTLRFNQLLKPFTLAQRREYQTLLDGLATAIRQQDLHTIGQVATRSAVLNQQIHAKRTLNDLILICERIAGLGVVVAHSGTCLGILLSPQDDRYQWQLSTARSVLTTLGETTSLYHTH